MGAEGGGGGGARARTRRHTRARERRKDWRGEKRESRRWDDEMVVTATESSTTKYVNVVLTPRSLSRAPSASLRCRRHGICCRSFGDYTNEVVQREKCTFPLQSCSRSATYGIKKREKGGEREWRQRKVKTFRLAIAGRIADNIFFAESPLPRRMGFPSTRFRLNPSRTEPAFIRTLLPSILLCTCFYTHLSRKSPFQLDARTADCPFDDRSEYSAFSRDNHLFFKVLQPADCNDRLVITINWPEHTYIRTRSIVCAGTRTGEAQAKRNQGGEASSQPLY